MIHCIYCTGPRTSWSGRAHPAHLVPPPQPALEASRIFSEQRTWCQSGDHENRKHATRDRHFIAKDMQKKTGNVAHISSYEHITKINQSHVSREKNDHQRVTLDFPRFQDRVTSALILPTSRPLPSSHRANFCGGAKRERRYRFQKHNTKRRNSTEIREGLKLKMRATVRDRPSADHYPFPLWPSHKRRERKSANLACL